MIIIINPSPQIPPACVKFPMTECLQITGVNISVHKWYSPPPFWKRYFSPSRHVVFQLPSFPFYLNFSLGCIYFTLLPPLLSFSYPLSSFFFPFFSHFSLFLFLFSYPRITSADISPRGRGLSSNMYKYPGKLIGQLKGIVQRIPRGVNTKLKLSVLVNWRPDHFSFWI